MSQGSLYSRGQIGRRRIWACVVRLSPLQGRSMSCKEVAAMHPERVESQPPAFDLFCPRQEVRCKCKAFVPVLPSGKGAFDCERVCPGLSAHGVLRRSLRTFSCEHDPGIREVVQSASDRLMTSITMLRIVTTWVERRSRTSRCGSCAPHQGAHGHTSPASGGAQLQLRQPQHVERGAGKHEQPINLRQPAQLDLPYPGDGLQPRRAEAEGRGHAVAGHGRDGGRAGRGAG